MASSGLQPVRLTKLGHNVLDTSENQFTENKRDLFSVKHPGFPRASQQTFRGCSCVGDTPTHFGFPPLAESKGQVAPTTVQGAPLCWWSCCAWSWGPLGLHRDLLGLRHWLSWELENKAMEMADAQVWKQQDKH